MLLPHVHEVLFQPDVFFMLTASIFCLKFSFDCVLVEKLKPAFCILAFFSHKYFWRKKLDIIYMHASLNGATSITDRKFWSLLSLMK